MQRLRYKWVICLIKKAVKPVIAFILLMSLAGGVAGQDARENGYCKVHNKVMCGNNTCVLLSSYVSNCCQYKKPYSRIVGGQRYMLLNPCEDILLYKQEVRVNKWISYHYFFSKEIDSPAMKLTKANLKLAYPEDVEFRQKLDEIFSNDSQLIRFDGLYNMYVVNWLYARVKE